MKTAAKWFAGLAFVAALFATTTAPAVTTAGGQGHTTTMSTNKDSGWD